MWRILRNPVACINLLAAILGGCGNGKMAATEKDWLRAEELAELYGLPRTWFEERGRAGDIERTKPGRYVGECAEFCGLNHGYMDFVVEAVPASQFSAALQRSVQRSATGGSA